MLDNRRVAPYFPPAYYLAMTGIAFRDRVIEAMAQQGLSKAELSRKSKVPYHALDKFLKREGATTSSENATSLANALGIKVDDDREYEELRKLFYQLSEEQRKFLLASARGLAD
ncbi:helix-turn-helix transcriptional regulator [Sulfitobacter sp. 20_GPM-1509m]|uniref:helix-turn-helix domain-containing protein n=1 Tax=Sulfitobacter sp. 20_GPM-1509m TaxID=1380367 RepID=UPI0012DEB8C5|nr:helix-turn-helix transcriptional regulator [Sulfitobacter sp. 20_GPM-1509m]